MGTAELKVGASAAAPDQPCASAALVRLPCRGYRFRTVPTARHQSSSGDLLVRLSVSRKRSASLSCTRSLSVTEAAAAPGLPAATSAPESPPTPSLRSRPESAAAVSRLRCETSHTQHTSLRMYCLSPSSTNSTTGASATVATPDASRASRPSTMRVSPTHLASLASLTSALSTPPGALGNTTWALGCARVPDVPIGRGASKRACSSSKLTSATNPLATSTNATSFRARFAAASPSAGGASAAALASGCSDRPRLAPASTAPPASAASLCCAASVATAWAATAACAAASGVGGGRADRPAAPGGCAAAACSCRCSAVFLACLSASSFIAFFTRSFPTISITRVSSDLAISACVPVTSACWYSSAMGFSFASSAGELCPSRTTSAMTFGSAIFTVVTGAAIRCVCLCLSPRAP
mmetsp:Transcript_946/g.2523  ORF Transcript_946/g.2523 Transcript_946/m.2523 type:complete len:412 (-) Transcript_946:9-1244(-)